MLNVVTFFRFANLEGFVENITNNISEFDDKQVLYHGFLVLLVQKYLLWKKNNLGNDQSMADKKTKHCIKRRSIPVT